MIVLTIAILYSLTAKNKGVVKLNLNGLATSICKVHIIIGLFPFLGKMINYIEDGEAKICLARTVRAIDDAILYYIILNGIRAEIIVAMPCQVQLYSIGKSSEIFYGKLCKHNFSVLIFSAKIIKEIVYP